MPAPINRAIPPYYSHARHNGVTPEHAGALNSLPRPIFCLTVKEHPKLSRAGILLLDVGFALGRLVDVGLRRRPEGPRAEAVSPGQEAPPVTGSAPHSRDRPGRKWTAVVSAQQTQEVVQMEQSAGPTFGDLRRVAMCALKCSIHNVTGQQADSLALKLQQKAPTSMSRKDVKSGLKDWADSVKAELDLVKRCGLLIQVFQ